MLRLKGGRGAHLIAVVVSSSSKCDESPKKRIAGVETGDNRLPPLNLGGVGPPVWSVCPASREKEESCDCERRKECV